MFGAQHPRFWILLLLVSLVGVGVAGAVPTPIGFEPDDGSELFLPLANVISTETFDFFAGEFGFFFEGSTTLIPIFQVDDQSGLGQPPQRASIDFVLGRVFDVATDGTPTLQNSFLPLPGSSIGFYAIAIGITRYSVAALNPPIVGDVFESFPQIGNPTGYMLAFESPGGLPVTTHFADGITTAAVPIVGTPALVLIALAAAAGFHRRSRKRD